MAGEIVKNKVTNVFDQFFIEQGFKVPVIDEYGYISILDANGDFKKYTKKELAIYRLIVLLSIPEGTYINDPDLGVNLMRYIYRPMTEENVENIKEELRKKILKYEKDLSLVDVKAFSDEVYKTIYFRLFLIYTPTNEKIVLDFDFIQDMQILSLRSA